MKSLRHLFALFFLLAGLAVVPAAAAKPPPAKTVTDVFAVTYDAKVTFEHHKAHPEFTGDDTLRYKLHGRLPDLTFVDGILQTSRSAVVKAKAKGLATSEVVQAPWSMNCVGGKVTVRGLVGVARLGENIGFLPAFSSEPRGQCIDSDGVRSNFLWDVPWPGEGLGGSKVFKITRKSIDVPKWSKPFRIVFEDEKCPNYEPELTIACTFVIQGKLTMIRVDREEATDVPLDLAQAGKGAVRPLALSGPATVKAGRVTVPVSNPNGFGAKGSLELRLGAKTLGRAALAVPAHGERKLTVKLGAAAQATLKRSTATRLSAVATFRDPAGKAHRTSSSVALAGTGAGGKGPEGPKGPPVPVEEVGPDGTYAGADGLTVVVADGKVSAFDGQITTYCATSGKQKLVPFGMYGDDPAPEVAADGSFAYEATTGYGFVKLKYEGRIDGDTATGNLVVEDRSPMSTSDGRLAFDYCFAGADWTATR
jgi:hypothetical protein